MNRFSSIMTSGSAFDDKWSQVQKWWFSRPTGHGTGDGGWRIFRSFMPLPCHGASLLETFYCI
jgi:hypothetical protein